MERWVRSCRTELLDRTLVWNQAHLLHALREYEQFYNQHRPTALSQAPRHCVPYPDRSANPTGSPTSRSIDATASAAPSTSTNMRRDQPGRFLTPTTLAELHRCILRHAQCSQPTSIARHCPPAQPQPRVTGERSPPPPSTPRPHRRSFTRQPLAFTLHSPSR
ncbi:hypothetical protein [Streptomyces sp. NPDC059753]